MVQPYNYLRQKVQTPKLYVSDLGMDLLNRCLAYNPKRRITAQKALEHEWFREEPRPKASHAFPMWPSRAEVDKKRTPVNNEIEHDDKRYKLV